MLLNHFGPVERGATQRKIHVLRSKKQQNGRHIYVVPQFLDMGQNWHAEKQKIQLQQAIKTVAVFAKAYTNETRPEWITQFQEKKPTDFAEEELAELFEQLSDSVHNIRDKPNPRFTRVVRVFDEYSIEKKSRFLKPLKKKADAGTITNEQFTELKGFYELFANDLKGVLPFTSANQAANCYEKISEYMASYNFAMPEDPTVQTLDRYCPKWSEKFEICSNKNEPDFRSAINAYYPKVNKTLAWLVRGVIALGLGVGTFASMYAALGVGVAAGVGAAMVAASVTIEKLNSNESRFALWGEKLNRQWHGAYNHLRSFSWKDAAISTLLFTSVAILVSTTLVGAFAKGAQLLGVAVGSVFAFASAAHTFGSVFDGVRKYLEKWPAISFVFGNRQISVDAQLKEGTLDIAFHVYWGNQRAFGRGVLAPQDAMPEDLSVEKAERVRKNTVPQLIKFVNDCDYQYHEKPVGEVLREEGAEQLLSAFYAAQTFRLAPVTMENAVDIHSGHQQGLPGFKQLRLDR